MWEDTHIIHPSAAVEAVQCIWAPRTPEAGWEWAMDNKERSEWAGCLAVEVRPGMEPTKCP